MSVHIAQIIQDAEIDRINQEYDLIFQKLNKIENSLKTSPLSEYFVHTIYKIFGHPSISKIRKLE